MRVNRFQDEGRACRADVGRRPLGRPGGFQVIHLFVILGAEGGRRDKGVADEFIAALEPKTLLSQVHKPFQGGSKDLRIGGIPVARDEEDLPESGFQALPEKPKEKTVDKGLLLADHLFVAAGVPQRREEIAAEDENLHPRFPGGIQDLLVENLFSMKV
jgi:hypothetical protein